MDEQRRAVYLEAMGIEMFVPRYILPAATAPVQAPLPAPATLAADVQPDESDSLQGAEGAENPPGPTKVGGMVSGIIGELSGEKSSRAQPRAQQGAEPSSPAKRVLDVLEQPAPAESIHFSLNLWRVSERVLIIDSHQSRQALPTGALLSNILFAKGLRVSLPRPEVLVWPMAGAAVGETGWPHACEMVQAFLKARCDRQPVRTIWLMGEAAYRAVFAGADDHGENIGKLRELGSLGASALVLPSLADILKSPALKAPVWQAVKAQDVD